MKRNDSLLHPRGKHGTRTKKIDKTIDISGVTLYSEFYYDSLLWRSVPFCVEGADREKVLPLEMGEDTCPKS